MTRKQKEEERKRFIERRLKELDGKRSATNARVAAVLRTLSADVIIQLRNDGADPALCDKALAGDADSLYEIAENLDLAQQIVSDAIPLDGAEPAPTKIYQA